MTRRGYSRADVTTHPRGYGYGMVPAVNVKVYDGPDDVSDADWESIRQAEAGGDPRFTRGWVKAHVNDDAMMDLFNDACEGNWELIQSDAEWIFDGYRVKVHAEGRSGGWAIVGGLPDLDDWDAVLLAKWRKFARFARGVADDVPYQMVSMLALNDFAHWAEADDIRLECEATAEPVMVA